MWKSLLRDLAIVLMDSALSLASSLVRRKSRDLPSDPLSEIQADSHVSVKDRED